MCEVFGYKWKDLLFDVVSLFVVLMVKDFMFEWVYAFDEFDLVVWMLV